MVPAAILLLCMLTREEDIQAWALNETAAWLGGRPCPRPRSERERFWFRIYGLAYWLYRLSLNFATLLIAWHIVFPRYHGPGAVWVLIVLASLNSDLIRRLVGRGYLRRVHRVTS